MKSFVYKTHFGDFFDVFHMPSPLAQKGMVDGVCVASFGATRRQEAIVARYFGDLDLTNTAEFAFSLESLFSGPVKLVVLDFSALNIFCRNAVTHLVNVAASIQGSQQKLVLYRPGHVLTSQLAELNLLPMFSIVREEDDLILALPDFDAE